LGKDPIQDHFWSGITIVVWLLTVTVRSRKGKSATKKNRLALIDLDVTIPSSSSGRKESEESFGFVVSVLAGRTVWTLTAVTDKERQVWVGSLVLRKRKESF
jgi:hypothetical protein